MTEDTSPAREIAASCLVVRARVVSRALTALYDDALRPFGLTTPQVNILVAVAMGGRLAPSRLGEILQMEKSTVSRNMDRLVEAGWVEAVRAPSGRRQEYAITAAGLDMLARIRAPWREAQDKARALLGEDGSAALCHAAAKVFGA